MKMYHFCLVATIICGWIAMFIKPWQVSLMFAIASGLCFLVAFILSKFNK